MKSTQLPDILNGRVGKTINKEHFHTFDALRFFAFVKVFLLHLPIHAFSWFSFVKSGGALGVLFFFTLSGFLISYLILQEKLHTGKFNLKNFFARRILRIWPLYFIMVAFAYSTPFILEYFNLPYSNLGYEPDWRFSVLFLENYKTILENDHPNVSPLVVMWSLCVEEHFYIIWGLLLYFFPARALPKISIAAILLALVSRKVFFDLELRTADLLTNLDLFAFGSLLAYIVVTQRGALEGFINSIASWKKYFFIVFVMAVVTLESLLFHNYYGRIIQPSVLGLLFAMLVAIFIPARSSLKISSNHILSRWGKITYGMYLIHTIITNLLLKVFVAAHFPLHNGWYALLFAIVAFLITLVLSEISYVLIEKPFLKFKKYFYGQETKKLVLKGKETAV